MTGSISLVVDTSHVAVGGVIFGSYVTPSQTNPTPAVAGKRKAAVDCERSVCHATKLDGSDETYGIPDTYTEKSSRPVSFT